MDVFRIEVFCFWKESKGKNVEVYPGGGARGLCRRDISRSPNGCAERGRTDDYFIVGLGRMDLREREYRMETKHRASPL